MKNWFESKVSFEQVDELGKNKKVSETYLINAQSWTEAESRTIENVSALVSDFIISDIKRSNVSELFKQGGGDLFFKAKVQFVSFDEVSGKEKRDNVYMLVQATDIDKAQEILKIEMKGTVSDWIIVEVKESRIVDVLHG